MLGTGGSAINFAVNAVSHASAETDDADLDAMEADLNSQLTQLDNWNTQHTALIFAVGNAYHQLESKLEAVTMLKDENAMLDSEEAYVRASRSADMGMPGVQAAMIAFYTWQASGDPADQTAYQNAYDNLPYYARNAVDQVKQADATLAQITQQRIQNLAKINTLDPAGDLETQVQNALADVNEMNNLAMTASDLKMSIMMALDRIDQIRQEKLMMPMMLLP